MLGSLFLAGCSTGGGAPTPRFLEIQSVKNAVYNNCNHLDVDLEYVASVIGPTPVNVTAEAAKICANPPILPPQ